MKEHRQITEILDQVEEHLPVGSKIIVACSGGADSIALAAALLHDCRKNGSISW